jgi:hypothetical protein
MWVTVKAVTPYRSSCTRWSRFGEALDDQSMSLPFAHPIGHIMAAIAAAMSAWATWEILSAAPGAAPAELGRTPRNKNHRPVPATTSVSIHFSPADSIIR